MNPAQVVIEMSPSRVELAVLKRGEVVGARSQRSAQADWGGAWPETLATLAPVVTAWVNELNVSGASAVVLYTMPTTAAGVMSCPASVGAQAEQRAALLALGSMASFPVATNPNATLRLMLDTEALVAEGGAATPKQSHTLATADTEATAAQVAGFVRQCGLVPAQLVPIGAVELAACVAEVGSLESCGAVLWVGSHSSVFAAGHRGSLRFVRSLSIGLEALVDAMTRPGRGRGSDSMMPALERARAREILSTIGIPSAQNPEHADEATLLPLMTPVLQRLANEVKQSLRFGLNEQERGSVAIRIGGAAAAVQRMGAVLALFSGAKVEAVDAATQPAPASTDATSAERGPIAWWRSLKHFNVNLAPATIMASTRSRGIRRAAYAGLGLCVAVMAIEAGWTHFALSQERSILETARQASAQANQRAAVQTAATNTVAQQRTLEGRVRDVLGQGTDWSAVLALLSSSTPSNVRLLSIEMVAADGPPTMRIAGVVKAGGSTSGSGAASAVKAYADALSASALVQGVKMGSAARGGGEDEGSLRFDVQVTLVGVPTTAIGGIGAPTPGAIAEGSPK